LIQKARDNFLDRYTDVVKKTGGQIMGAKTLAKRAKVERLRQKEILLKSK